MLTLGGCASRAPDTREILPIPPISEDKWRAIQEEIWIASTLAHSEAQNYASGTMGAWMTRVREKTESEFVPWYADYWTQQWIGLKAGWYEISHGTEDPPVQDYLAAYIQDKYYELVLEPAATPSDPHAITRQTTALYIQLLSQQLQCLPRMFAVQPRSLRNRLQQVPLITLTGSNQD